MKIFKIPPHSDSHFCEELYAMKDTYERHNAEERWYIFLLGGARLKFALPTAQSIPKAHSIKYFSLLKKLKVEFTSGAAAVSIQY